MRKTPEERLMIGVLAQMIQDFMSAKELTGFSFKRISKKERRQRARMTFILNYRLLQIKEILETAKNQSIDQKCIQRIFKLLASVSRLRYEIGASSRKQKVYSRGRMAEQYIFDDSWDSERYVFGFGFICRYFDLDPEKLRQKIRELKREDIQCIRKIATKRGKKP